MAVLLLIVGLTGFLILQRRQKGTVAAAKSPPPQPGVAISTAVAEQGSIGVYINALGSVAPVYTVTVKSRVDGQLISVNYREDQMINQGTCWRRSIRGLPSPPIYSKSNPEDKLFDLLTALVESYEEKNYPIPDPASHEVYES